MKHSLLLVSLIFGILLNFTNKTIIQAVIGTFATSLVIFIGLVLLTTATESVKKKHFLNAALRIVPLFMLVIIILIIYLSFHQAETCRDLSPAPHQNIITRSCSDQIPCNLPWYLQEGCTGEEDPPLS